MRNILPVFFYRKLAEFRIRRKASEIRNRWADRDKYLVSERSCMLSLREPPPNRPRWVPTRHLSVNEARSDALGR
jgi:hypothetical protein